MKFWNSIQRIVHHCFQAIAMGVLSGDALMMSTGPTCGIVVEVPLDKAWKYTAPTCSQSLPHPDALTYASSFSSE
jgi:hypothetical protein